MPAALALPTRTGGASDTGFTWPVDRSRRQLRSDRNPRHQLLDFLAVEIGPHSLISNRRKCLLVITCALNGACMNPNDFDDSRSGRPPHPMAVTIDAVGTYGRRHRTVQPREQFRVHMVDNRALERGSHPLRHRRLTPCTQRVRGDPRVSRYR